jgi:hypothetical protein
MKKILSSFAAFCFSFFSLSYSAVATTYYVSLNGDDTKEGTSVATAWQTVNKVNSTILQPGDKVLFEAGQTFQGTLQADQSGTITEPIVYSSYGKGFATISSGLGRGFLAYNTAALEIRRLHFVGAGREVNNTGGLVFFRDDLTTRNTQLTHLLLDSVEVSGYQSYGITVGSYNTALDFLGQPFGYDDVRITNSSTHDNGDTGIYSYGATLYAHRNWYIGNCKSFNNSGQQWVKDRNTGSGIILANVDGGLVEQSEAHHNGWLSNHYYTGPAGIWAYASNNITIQNCESHHNQSGTLDGGGFDLDGGCTNSVLQYNYSHDNDGPGLMLAQYDGAPTTMAHVTIRYNISENDARRYGSGILLWSAGGSRGISNANVYNNTVYMSPSASGYVPKAVYLSGPNIENSGLRNNIFQTTDGIQFLVDESGRVAFQGNCYWSTGGPQRWRQWASNFTSLEEWRAYTGAEKVQDKPTGMVTDPMLNAPGQGGTNPLKPGQSMSDWKAYQLQVASPLRGAGLDLKTLFNISPGKQDLYGYPIPPAGVAANIGAQGGSSGSVLPVELVRFQAHANGAAIALHWATATERNSAFFEIQRSADGKIFQKVGQIAAAGNSSSGRTYTWDDTTPLSQLSYYRLRQVDVDGSAHFSAVVAVSPGAAAPTEYSVFPNPAKRGEMLYLNLTALAGQTAQLTISSLTGQVVLRQPLTAATAPTAVHLPAQLAPGTYFVSVGNSQQTLRTRLVIE